MYNREGTPLWKAFIGEFPMVQEIDADYNVYAAGKNRELFSFDVNGNLRWWRRIANHVVSAGANNSQPMESLSFWARSGAGCMPSTTPGRSPGNGPCLADFKGTMHLI